MHNHNDHSVHEYRQKNDNHSQHQINDKHAGHSVAIFRQKFWLTLLLTLPVVIYSPVIQEWFKFNPPAFIGSNYVPFIFSTIVFFYGGLVFIRGAWREIKSKTPGMMILISLAIITAYTYSVVTEFFISGDNFFWELATLITVMLLGHWLEMASIKKAESSLDAIKQLLPDKTEKIVDGISKTVLVSELVIGDIVLVKPGSNIPIDGVVVDGVSSVDESAITGESKPIDKAAGSGVIAGTINQDGALTIKITKAGDDTMLAGIMRLVDEAQHSKSNAQILADKAAFILTIIAIITAVVTVIVWSLLKNVGFGIERSVAVLIIACPHALGLAVPLVVSISTALAARNGLLIRKRLALETARNLDIVLFDKTGTLTKGEHSVTDILVTKGYSNKDILRLSASLEQNSEHVIGKGIVIKARDQRINLEKINNFVALPGVGVKGIVSGKEYLAVSRNYIDNKKISVPTIVAQEVGRLTKQGKTEVYLLLNSDVIGVILLADMVREEARRAISDLKQLGIKTAMITGDSKDVAVYIAGQLEIDQYFAEVKPEDKSNKVKELQLQGMKVAMVGDGVNDAIALTQADIGIAIGAGTDVAIKSADIILIKSDPSDVVKVIKLSRATYLKMTQNLIWATGYNIFAIPLAAGVLYNFGFVLSPAVGAILMSASTIIVALNAQFLRRVKLN